jgi:hypothetical protein
VRAAEILDSLEFFLAVDSLPWLLSNPEQVGSAAVFATLRIRQVQGADMAQARSNKIKKVAAAWPIPAIPCDSGKGPYDCDGRGGRNRTLNIR